MRQFTTDDFNWIHQTFVAEASALQFPPGTCLREFEIRNPRTQRVLRFTFSHSQRDSEGDVQYWVFQSDPLPTTQKHLSAKIFND